MDHSQVTIQTDTAQETNADVDVLVEKEATHLTQPFPMTPIIILKEQHNETNETRQYAGKNMDKRG